MFNVTNGIRELHNVQLHECCKRHKYRSYELGEQSPRIDDYDKRIVFVPGFGCDVDGSVILDCRMLAELNMEIRTMLK
ncbi:hypothetical protein Trydic_g4431 [Trypoxylus dichotomus]